MRLSRVMRHAAALVAVLVLLAARSVLADNATESNAGGGETKTNAEQLVRDALEAEAEGDGERRAGYLQDALAADSDSAPAHWHSGDVRVADKWLSIDAAAAATVRAGKMAQYRRLRDQVDGTADAQLKLARWCAGAGLKEQGRVHLMYALQSRPATKVPGDVVAKLGLVRHQGVLLPPANAEADKQQAKHAEAAIQEWKSRLAAIRHELESQSTARRSAAIDQLRSIRDPTAILALEKTFAKSKSVVGEGVVAALAAMPGQDATDSLIRHAIFAQHDGVRQAAAAALKPRSIFSYVPTMISALQSPVEVQFEAYFMNGQFRHRLALYQEGPAVDRAFVSASGSQVDTTVPVDPRFKDYSVKYTPDRTVGVDAMRAEQELAANGMREEMNERVVAALRTATGNDLDVDLKQWWSWWYDYNEMYQPPYKPVSQVYVDTTPATPYTFQVRSISCFVEGTPVWTSTGPMPIEQVRIGECVLAQDPESGELAYKPVMATTMRPPSPLIEIHVAGETIQATRGHPFWVDGIGWQMAKELKAGQYLHTTHGPAQVESAEQKGEAPCYNLVVADFNTYFVSDAQVLVHDNNLRQVTTATVPGLTDNNNNE